MDQNLNCFPALRSVGFILLFIIGGLRGIVTFIHLDSFIDIYL